MTEPARLAAALTVYSAQHESLVRTMLENFTDETGIELEVRDASVTDLANQIAQEGKVPPVDVFLTENSPAIDVADDARLVAPLDEATLDQVDPAYRPRPAAGWASPPAPPRSSTPGRGCPRPSCRVPDGLRGPGLGGPRRHRCRRRGLPGDRQ